MIYGKDEPMLFPVADLYDSGMMKELITAAREQYNLNREDMKDFIKTYGDFMSPFSADMDWVDRETRGRINDAMNYLQLNGIDPLRSAEGRAIILNVINGVDRAGINLRRANAKMGEEYLKARAQLDSLNKFNSEYENWILERLGLPNFENFDSSKGSWTRLSPSEYLNLNLYTGHLFDKMDDDYIETKDGYDWFGVSRERRALALTPNLLGLISSDLGRYHYENAKKDARLILGREPTELEIMLLFKDNILTSTKEYEHRTRKENEEYGRSRQFYYSDLLDARKSARDLANNMALDDYKTNNEIRKYNETGGALGSTGTRGTRTNNKPGEESFKDSQWQLERGVSHILNQTAYGESFGIVDSNDFDPEAYNIILPAAQQDIASKVYPLYTDPNTKITYPQQRMFVFDANGKMKLNPNYGKIQLGNGVVTGGGTLPSATTKAEIKELKTSNENFIDKLSIDYQPKKFANWIGRSTISTDSAMASIVNDTDAINRIYSVDEIALHAHGVDRSQSDINRSVLTTKSIRKALTENLDQIYMKSVGKMATVVLKDGSVRCYQLVKIYKGKPTSSSTFTPTEQKSLGIVAYDMGIKTYNNPNFGINGNLDVNLYLDERQDADVRFMGDVKVLQEERIKPPAIDGTVAYPYISNP